MKNKLYRYQITACLLLLFVCFLFPLNIHAESGSDKYTPTKLEWLVVYLNSTNSLDDVFFLGIPPDTIAIALYDDAKSRNSFKFARLAINQIAIKKGWSWIKIREEVLPPVEKSLKEALDNPKNKFERSLKDTFLNPAKK